MNPKRYCQIFLLLAGGVLLLVVLLNLLVDPLGAYPQVHLRAFAPERDSLFTRVARAELAGRGPWDMAIYGTSRPKAGLPSVHPAFAAHQVCNLSVDAAIMSEAAVILDYTAARNPLRRVLLCLDFAMFRTNRIDPLGFDESRFNPDLSLFDYHCKNLIGAAVTGDAWAFIRNRLWHKRLPEGQQRGFFVHSLKPGAIQRNVFEKQLRSLARGNAVVSVPPAEMQSLRHFLATCREHRIELTLAINPVHALDLELLQAAQKWDIFEQWKRDVVQIVTAEAPGGEVMVWDFTGYAGVPAEEIPPAGSTNRMKFYFENSHYTPVTGALMLDRIYGLATNDFGVKISPANIDAHLETIRVQRESYVAGHPGEVEWVRRISQQMLAVRRQASAPAETQ